MHQQILLQASHEHCAGQWGREANLSEHLEMGTHDILGDTAGKECDDLGYRDWHLTMMLSHPSVDRFMEQHNCRGQRL